MLSNMVTGKETDLTVSCYSDRFAESLLASVRDCGKGFDPDALPDPADPVIVSDFPEGVSILSGDG